MRTTMTMTCLTKTFGGLLLLGATILPAHAGAGHDHGEAPAATSGAASPRFAATSENFELVGILNEKNLALYLDRATDNSPVKNAKLELEIAGKPVAVEAVGEGEFLAKLDAALPEGSVPVTATIVAGQDSDLLAADLDVHAAAHSDNKATGMPWKPLAGVGVLILVLTGFLRMKRVRATGGAA
jgi:hypothetical protein